MARNASSDTFNAPEGLGVVLVPFANLQETMKQRRQDTIGYAAFALPAYSEDGYAIVFGYYTCGGRCGRGELFLLDRASGKWQVMQAWSLFQS